MDVVPPRVALRLPRWGPPAVVVLATVAAFLPGVFGEFVGWDDNRNFLELPHYRGLGPRQLSWMFTAFQMGHYHPLTWVTLGADYVLWGMNPLGYHLTSLALHVATAVVFLHVAGRLLRTGLQGRLSEPALRIGATGAALLFAVHPLRVESVVWLSERRDVLSGLFYVLTVLAYLRAGARPPGADAGHRERRRAWYGAVGGFFFCALLSKALVVSLPVVLVILDVYPLRRLGGAAGWLGPGPRRVWAEKIPFFALGLMGAVVAFVARAPLEAAPGLQEFDVVARLAVSVYGLAFYLWKTVLPVGLSPLYEMPRLLVLLSPPFVLSGIAVLLLGSVAVGARRRWPALTAAAAAYLVTLLPVIGIVQSGPQITADRYSYLACLGWALLAGAGLAWCAERWRDDPARRLWSGAVLTAATVLVVIAVGASARQSLVWRDSFSVWGRVLAVDPESARAHTGLAGAFFADGRREEAEQHLEQALKLSPSLPEALIGRAVTLGVSGRAHEAVRYAREAARLRPLDPEMHRLLGNILSFDRRPEEALTAFREAARLDPRSTVNRYAIAVMLADLGHRDEALATLEEADRLARVVSPGDPESDRYRAMVLSRLDPERAKAAWRRYLAAMGTVAHPSRPQRDRMLEALVKLEALEQLAGRPDPRK